MYDPQCFVIVHEHVSKLAKSKPTKLETSIKMYTANATLASCTMQGSVHVFTIVCFDSEIHNGGMFKHERRGHNIVE